MLATTPPTENTIALRVAILDLTRHRLSPLFEGDQLDALPAWLWSLPAHKIAGILPHPPEDIAGVLASMLEDETARRHPAERFASHLEHSHPHLSLAQRARLADFAVAFADLRDHYAEVTTSMLERRGFPADESRRLKDAAILLIAEVEGIDTRERCFPVSRQPARTAAEYLRWAGERAHARRAFADGEIEACALAASRPAATSSTTGAPR